MRTTSATRTPATPYASPLLARDHSGLPPALVQVAEHDPIRDDGLRYAAALRGGRCPGADDHLRRHAARLPVVPKLCRSAQALGEVCAELHAALEPAGPRRRRAPDPPRRGARRLTRRAPRPRVRRRSVPFDPLARIRSSASAAWRGVLGDHVASRSIRSVTVPPMKGLVESSVRGGAVVLRLRDLGRQGRPCVGDRGAGREVEALVGAGGISVLVVDGGHWLLRSSTRRNQFRSTSVMSPEQPQQGPAVTAGRRPRGPGSSRSARWSSPPAWRGRSRAQPSRAGALVGVERGHGRGRDWSTAVRCCHRSPTAPRGGRLPVPQDPGVPMTTFDAPAGPLPAYAATPDGDGPWPGVVVVHDAFGMTDDVRRITDRFAANGLPGRRAGAVPPGQPADLRRDDAAVGGEGVRPAVDDVLAAAAPCAPTTGAPGRSARSASAWAAGSPS